MKPEDRVNTQYAYSFEGCMSDMQLVLKMFRCGFKTIGGIEVERVLDHSKDADTRPGADPGSAAIEYRLAGGSSVEIRPSAHEPNLEVYISITDDDKGSAAEAERRVREDLESIVYMDSRMGFCCE